MGQCSGRGVCVCVCVTPICGFVLIAETASTDKQMSLEGVVIITIYPHGLVEGSCSALFMGLFVNDKVTLTVINLGLLRVGRVV